MFPTLDFESVSLYVLAQPGAGRAIVKLTFERSVIPLTDTG